MIDNLLGRWTYLQKDIGPPPTKGAAKQTVTRHTRAENSLFLVEEKILDLVADYLEKGDAAPILDDLRVIEIARKKREHTTAKTIVREVLLGGEFSVTLPTVMDVVYLSQEEVSVLCLLIEGVEGWSDLGWMERDEVWAIWMDYHHPGYEEEDALTVLKINMYKGEGT